MPEVSAHRPWLRPLLVGVAIFAIAGASMAFVFFVHWTDVSEAQQTEAEQALNAAASQAGGGTPYIEFAEDRTIIIHREQEGSALNSFKNLTVLSWSPDDNKIIRLEYPSWFVRMKTASSLNFGTMIAAVRKDWAHLDLSVSYDDLRRRGPALLLDHQLDSGARIVIWTSAISSGS